MVSETVHTSDRSPSGGKVPRRKAAWRKSRPPVTAGTLTHFSLVPKVHTTTALLSRLPWESSLKCDELYFTSHLKPKHN